MRYRNPKTGQWAKRIPIGSTVSAEWSGHTTDNGKVIAHIGGESPVMPEKVKLPEWSPYDCWFLDSCRIAP